MTGYRVLALTDHRSHTKENSLYGLASALDKHPLCQSIHVASRGQGENTAFFRGEEGAVLFASRVSDQFLYSESGKSFQKGANISIADVDIVLMRMPRPISDEFLLWLEDRFKHAVFINRPSGIITTSDKSYLTRFLKFCPPLQLCYSVETIQTFAKDQDIVLKPLKAYGGQGILKISGNTLDDGAALFATDDYLKQQAETIRGEGYLAMKYLKKVSEGDKRIIVVGGEIVAASLRLPRTGSWLCNVAQGGVSEPTHITKEELEIIQGITPPLIEKGILIYGADTLVNDDGKRVLSEINTLSIGGFIQAERQTGKPILTITANKIIEYADEQLS